MGNLVVSYITVLTLNFNLAAQLAIIPLLSTTPLTSSLLELS